MNEAIVAMQGWLEGQGLSSNTIKAYTTDIQMFCQEMDIAQIDTAKLEEFAARWLNRYRLKKSAKTMGRRLTSMRSFGKYLGLAILANYKAPTPARAMPHPLPDLAHSLRRMMDEARTNEERALISLTGLCGCRISEARSIHPTRDIDMRNMILTIRGKGDKVRRVPISKEAWKYMILRVSEVMQLTGGMPDVNTRLVRISDRHARHIITKLGHDAGIPRQVSSHDLRATFATLAYYQSGKDINAVRELLGHESIQQTMLYVGLTLETMRFAADFELPDPDLEDAEIEYEFVDDDEPEEVEET